MKQRSEKNMLIPSTRSDLVKQVEDGNGNFVSAARVEREPTSSETSYIVWDESGLE